MKTRLWPWLLALGVTGLAMAARYLLIQPPEIAHQCDAAGGPWWCALRTAAIMTYSGYGLGYAALVLSGLAALVRRAALGGLALAVGGAALVLYCYEPGALAMAIGTLVLARAQHEAQLRRARLA
jgi:hypothetical protein